MNPIKEFLYRLQDEVATEKLVSMGMTVGKEFKCLQGVKRRSPFSIFLLDMPLQHIWQKLTTMIR